MGSVVPIQLCSPAFQTGYSGPFLSLKTAAVSFGVGYSKLPLKTCMNHSLPSLTRITDWHWEKVDHPDTSCVHLDETAGSPSLLPNVLERDELNSVSSSCTGWRPVGSDGHLYWVGG